MLVFEWDSRTALSFLIIEMDSCWSPCWEASSALFIVPPEGSASVTKLSCFMAKLSRK